MFWNFSETMKQKKKTEWSNLSREELLMLCIGDIIQELLLADKEGKDVNLNKTKTRLSSKYGLETSPKLVDIIAAVPSQYKKVLVPKLRAKPVRTASGIAVVAVMCKPHRFLMIIISKLNPNDSCLSLSNGKNQYLTPGAPTSTSRVTFVFTALEGLTLTLNTARSLTLDMSLLA